MPAMPTACNTRLFGLAAAALLAAPCLLVGCVQRTISVTSDPPGALVHLNDEEVGRTPVTVPFTFYGVYDVRLSRQGYQELWTEQQAPAPWWETPGPDLIAEMIPGARSHFDWHFTLEPAPELTDAEVISEQADGAITRATELRDRSRAMPDQAE